MKLLFFCENSQEVLTRMNRTHLAFHLMCHLLPQQPNAISIRHDLLYLFMYNMHILIIFSLLSTPSQKIFSFFSYTLIKTDADVSDIGELLIKNHQPQTAATCKVRVTQKKWGSWASLHFSRKLLKTKVLLEKSCTTVIDKWLIFKGFLDLCLKSLFSFIL